MRNKVSYQLFKSVFNNTAKAFCQKLKPNYKGYFLTSIDRDQCLLERTEDTIKEGYTSKKCGEKLENIGMKMYLSSELAQTIERIF
jgi:hypothetical protein